MEVELDHILDELWSLYETQDWKALYSVLNVLYKVKNSYLLIEDAGFQKITLLILNCALQRDLKDLAIILLRLFHRTIVLSPYSVSTVQFQFQAKLLESTKASSHTESRQLFNTLLYLWGVLSKNARHHSALVNIFKSQGVLDDVIKFDSNWSITVLVNTIASMARVQKNKATTTLSDVDHRTFCSLLPKLLPLLHTLKNGNYDLRLSLKFLRYVSNFQNSVSEADFQLILTLAPHIISNSQRKAYLKILGQVNLPKEEMDPFVDQILDFLKICLDAGSFPYAKQVCFVLSNLFLIDEGTTQRILKQWNGLFYEFIFDCLNSVKMGVVNEALICFSKCLTKDIARKIKRRVVILQKQGHEAVLDACTLLREKFRSFR